MPAASYKFDEFELDSRHFQLRRNGSAVKMERVPLELLLLLVGRNGDLVSRQEIAEQLWGKDVFVDADQGINTAIRKIRTALREDSEKPRFIQTISGKGYRFIAEVVSTNGKPVAQESGPVEEPKPAKGAVEVKPRSRPRALYWFSAAAALVALAGLPLGLNLGGSRDRIFKPRVGPIHTIAVLPLANLSGDASQDYYADGMTDELITALARNRSLRVISRTSIMQYKGANKPLREIAHSLGADGILEGSVNRSRNNVHVNLQLIYAPTDTHVWAQGYDRDLNSAMSLPDEISRTISAEAKVESVPAKSHHYVSPEAHDAYLRGRFVLFADESGDHGKAYFEKATELQPDYAAAWAALGYSYSELAAAGAGAPPRSALAKAEEYARKALELDPDLAEAHNTLASVCLYGKWDWQQAEAESLRAVELAPNFAEGHFVRGYVLLALNRDNEALEEAKRANEISPFERPWNLGFMYIMLHRYDAAVDELRSRADAMPQNPFFHSLLGYAYQLKVMARAAEREHEEELRLMGDSKEAELEHRVFEKGGTEAVGRLVLANNEKKARVQYISPYGFALQYATLGDRENTLKFLEKAYQEGVPGMNLLQKQPVFDFLHSDPRYRALVKKIGLPPSY